MASEGIIIEHETFGEGKIVRIDEKYIYVQFLEGEKRFQIYDSMGKFLHTRNKEDEKIILDEIEKFRRKEEAVETKIEKQKQQEKESIRNSYIRAEKAKIKKVIDDRQIRNLIHFTRIENLESILSHGIVPVDRHEEFGIRALRNDRERLDNKKDCTSFSIEFPNYELFFKYRESDYPNSKWVVIVISIDILFSDMREKYFSYTNAASNFCRKNEYCRKSNSEIGFEKMFQKTDCTNWNREIHRSSLKIPDSWSTNPQAEVLISGIINPQYITSVCFNSQEDLLAYQKNKENVRLGNFNFQYNPDYFKYRKDWESWKKEKMNGI